MHTKKVHSGCDVQLSRCRFLAISCGEAARECDVELSVCLRLTCCCQDDLMQDNIDSRTKIFLSVILTCFHPFNRSLIGVHVHNRWDRDRLHGFGPGQEAGEEREILICHCWGSISCSCLCDEYAIHSHQNPCIS